jgi:flavin reductase (DIM6/NTAB) family NADH-FMN oxidoreductase RutF
VSVLGEDQEDVSRRFALRGPAKLEGAALEDGDRAPLVKGAVAHLECVVTAAHAAGDHTIFVAEVRGLRAAPGRPLLYHRGAYRRIAGEDGSR